MYVVETKAVKRLSNLIVIKYKTEYIENFRFTCQLSEIIFFSIAVKKAVKSEVLRKTTKKRMAKTV